MSTGKTEKKKSPTSDVNELLTMLLNELNKVNTKLDSIAELNGKMLKMQEELLQKTTNKSYRREAIKRCCPYLDP